MYMQDFLDKLDAIGLSYWWKDDEIEYAPKSKLTPDIERQFVYLKPALLELRNSRQSKLHPSLRPVILEFPKQLLETPLPPPIAVPHVLFASHDLSLSGAPLVLANVLPRLRGMTTAVYSPVDGPLKQRFQTLGIPVLHTLNLADVDLLVANTLLSASAVSAAKEANVPCVWLIHEYEPDMCGNLEAVCEIIGYPQALFFPHGATANNYRHLRMHNTQVIYACVYPTPIRDRASARESLNLTREDFCIVTMGRDEPRKGQIDLREATKNLPVRAFYVYDEPDPCRYYAAADLYVCTSRMESFGLSIQEAKQYHMPVITTKLPSTVDQIHDGVHGLHYEPGDVVDLRNKIIQLYSDKELHSKLCAPITHLPSFLEVVEKYEGAFLEAAGCYRNQPIKVVYHAAGIGEHWKEIVTEQFQQLYSSGLKDVLATHVGEGLDWFLNEAVYRGINLTVTQHEPDVGNCEVLAMRLIERLARCSDKPILYLHTKGVTRPLSEEFYHEWRRVMMEGLVVNWRKNLLSLNGHDAVGVNWWTKHNHFSGNFWMATPSWIRKLPKFDTYYRDRYSCERWIGSIKGCRAISVFCQDKKFWSEDMELLYKLRSSGYKLTVNPSGDK